MEKIKAFLKNKSIGYYIVAGIALVALIISIVFFATYRNPDLATQMGNKADGLVVETIGIFLLAGFFVELVVLLLPQYRFVQIIAIVMFGLSFYKDVILIPDFIVGKINNVEYNGGNFGLNMFFFIAILLIVIASIVAAFLGFIKSDEENIQEMKKVKGTVNLIKIGSGAVVLVAAILVSSLVSNGLVTKSGKANKGDGQNSSSVEPEPEYNPITDEIIAIADAYDYDFDPLSVIQKEQETWDFSAVSSVPTNGTRADHNLVYYFEGSYSEGWQGDYSQTYGSLYLWDDGVFGGTADGTAIRGYWYNSSIANGEDPETGEDIKDCLNMVSNINNYKSIITEPATGFYHYQAYIYISKNGGRSMIMNGYEYYPEVALFIDTQSTEQLTCKVGEDVDISFWTPSRVLKNLSYSSIFIPTDVNWSAENGTIKIAYVDNQKARGIASVTANFSEAGEKNISISWNGLEASVAVLVTE